MIAFDTNILVYAHRREVLLGDAAHALVVGLAEGERPWAIPWPCCYEFLSVATNRRIWQQQASTPQEAWAQMRAWAASPSNRMIGETDGFFEVLERFVARPNVTGALVHDARVAAICVAHGVEALLTRDRDFTIFAELRTRDPFAATI